MKHNFLTGAFFLIAAGLGLSGCSSDDLMSDISTPVEKDTSFYINVQIASPTENSTRANDNNSAGDYENGTEDEQKIHKILFVFYNSSFQYVGNTVITPPAGQETITGTTIPDKGETGKPGSIENIVTITVPVDVPAGSLKPAYVMAYINPTVGTTDQQRSFVQTLGLTRTLDQMIPSGSGDNAHKGYTMTNSVYYENVTASAPAIAVPISEDQLCTKVEDANDAVLPGENNEDVKKKEKVIIYVERVVAKVNLKQTFTEGSLKQENNQISTDGESPVKYTLNFEVLGWGLSNLEKGTFLVKNFRTTSSGNCSDFDNPFDLTNMSYSVANTQFNDLKSPAWNMPSSTQNSDYWNISGHRSFWAMSPTYFTGGTYPPYADQAVAENNSSLEYLTFNDIYNTALDNPTLGAKGKEVKKDGTATTIYTLENTAQAEVVTNHQKRAVTCALIVGKYTIKDTDGNSYNNTTGSNDFFIRQGLDANGKNVQLLYPDEIQMKKAFLAQNNTIYLQTDNGETATPRYTYTPVRGTESHGDEDNPYLKDFQIYHPANTITDGNYTPNRFVTLKLVPAEDSNNKYYYYNANGDPELIDGTTTLEVVNKALYHNLNSVMPGVEKYCSGYAYFSVPIKHLWTKKSDGNDIPGIGEDGFTSATLGLYGIVRNHTYTINVQGISGIGIGIGDPSVPIIPNVETDKYFVRTEMRVQRWRVVPQQNVTLKP